MIGGLIESVSILLRILSIEPEPCPDLPPASSGAWGRTIGPFRIWGSGLFSSFNHFCVGINQYVFQAGPSQKSVAPSTNCQAHKVTSLCW